MLWVDVCDFSPLYCVVLKPGWRFFFFFWCGFVSSRETDVEPPFFSRILRPSFGCGAVKSRSGLISVVDCRLAGEGTVKAYRNDAR